MKAEFDLYIKDFRKNHDKEMGLVGESSAFMAEIKAIKLQEWIPQRATSAKTILDFGCGDGLMTSFVNKYFPQAEIFGVDPSLESIKIAQKNYPQLHFSTNYDEKPDLDFEDASFDLALAVGAFHHIPHNCHEGYFKEIFRTLKPNGCFVMFELNPYNPLTQYIFRKSPVEVNAKMLLPSYGYNMLKKYCKTTGSIRCNYYFFFPHFLRFLRPYEKYLIKFFLGGLYAIIVEKKH